MMMRHCIFLIALTFFLSAMSRTSKTQLRAPEHKSELSVSEELEAAFEENLSLPKDSIITDPAIDWAYDSGALTAELPLTFKGFRRLGPEIFHVPDVDGLIAQNFEPEAILVTGNPLSPNLKALFRKQHIGEALIYFYMIENPNKIEFLAWNFPKPPKIPDFDKKFTKLIGGLNPSILPTNFDKIESGSLGKRIWLHYFNVGLQFSQAYVSSNWYQGGNNHLALLFNFNWNVDLNTVYHPNLLFQSALSYKLAINSNPKESLHRLSVTQDNFQYNLKGGLKALKHWFYSFTLQLTTPLFNTYPADSPGRSAAFFSPGTFNLGLGMTYNRQNAKKTWKISASVAPISYNLKTCIARDVDHAQFNIPADARTASEVGSNLETNFTWKIADNITWTSRIFLFTDYKYFLTDWENTLNFSFNKFFSTQLYVHPRYDSSSDFSTSGWHYWMLKEILSLGLSYTFSTKG
ncbi:MAG: DUF3078 domain-containing protein [Clostridium sp.]|nr:DUF3078 domain-containing protein [Prevotella sp.]MCM1429526.1 DUF3078 domain-containing protein [Clostridium sp.]MCM1476142.1 DUF3078 domain-containing protein [Muribaculaceae bacterium]